MTVKKRSPVPGVVVYKRGNKWAYRVELERDPLTNARQWEYQSDSLPRTRRGRSG